MPYSGMTFAQAKTQLAERLNDQGKVFTTDLELSLHIQDAIRMWNMLTGDNKVSYPLITDAAKIWYDLQTIATSPAFCTLTDRDIYLRITYALLEPPSNLAVVQTAQFSQDEIINAVQRKRDEFLFKTGCTVTVETINIAANTENLPLPQNIIQTKRAYWLPASGGTPWPLFKTDEYAITAYNAFASSTASQPVAFSAGMEPPLSLAIIPPPSQAGQVELLTVETQAALAPGAATVIRIPNDFIPGLMWGALSDLLNFNLEAKDLPRAQIAQQRFNELTSLIEIYPNVFAARVAGVQIFADAVENLDIYQPTWRTANVSPNLLGLSGNNLVGYPVAAAQTITLLMMANASVPVVDSDAIQLGDEILDAVLDEAQATASFKMGGDEAVSAHQLHANIIKLAAKRNGKVRSMSCFRDVLYGRTQQEGLLVPLEATYDDNQ